MPSLDERRGVVKSPTEEEAKEIEESKKEAFLFLAGQLSDQQDLEPARSPSPEDTGSQTSQRELNGGEPRTPADFIFITV